MPSPITRRRTWPGAGEDRARDRGCSSGGGACACRGGRTPGWSRSASRFARGGHGPPACYLTAKYNKHYIGLARNGVARNLAIFRPRKSYVLAEFGIPHSDELTTRLEDACLDLIAYEVRWKQYRVRLTAEDLDSHEGELRELIERARTEYGG